MKAGSDTCIIPKNSLTVYDVFYIGIRCINQCKYSLRAFYTTISTLTNDVRSQFRLDGYSTNLFQYYIPSDATDGFTTAVRFSVETDEPYY